MEAQEIFDKIMAHLRAQNARAADVSGCLYRTDDGLKCAMGCLIPDKLYNHTMEGKGVSSLIVDHPELFKYLGIEDHASTYFLLRDMQSLHDDDLYPKKGWIEKAYDIGFKYNLITEGR